MSEDAHITQVEEVYIQATPEQEARVQQLIKEFFAYLD